MIVLAAAVADTRLRARCSLFAVLGSVALISYSNPATADVPELPPKMALGFNLDLLPTVLSAAHDKWGYAPQVWLGVGHARIRFVGSRLEPPNAFAFAPRGFRNPSKTVFASIIDYTFGSHFDGPWLGSGFEIWEDTIQHDDVAQEARWNSVVFTVGGGYIWRFSGDFFVDPWAGAHAVLNPQRVQVGAFSYQPFPLQAEASLKIGWFTPI